MDACQHNHNCGAGVLGVAVAYSSISHAARRENTFNNFFQLEIESGMLPGAAGEAARLRIPLVTLVTFYTFICGTFWSLLWLQASQRCTHVLISA